MDQDLNCSNLKNFIDQNFSAYEMSQFTLDIKGSDTILFKSIKMFNHNFITKDDAIIDYIKQHPEEINIMNTSGNTPLYYSCSAGKKTEHIILALIDGGADVNYIHQGRTPLHSIIINYCATDCTELTIIPKIINFGAYLEFNESHDINFIGTIFDYFIHVIDAYYSYPLFNYFIKINAPLKIYNGNHNVSQHIKILKIESELKLLKEQNDALFKQNKQLRTELDMHPDSDFVKMIKEHFDDLTKK